MAEELLQFTVGWIPKWVVPSRPLLFFQTLESSEHSAWCADIFKVSVGRQSLSRICLSQERKTWTHPTWGAGVGTRDSIGFSPFSQEKYRLSHRQVEPFQSRKNRSPDFAILYCEERQEGRSDATGCFLRLSTDIEDPSKTSPVLWLLTCSSLFRQKLTGIYISCHHPFILGRGYHSHIWMVSMQYNSLLI